jgi:F-type H+-transporting ATPase subunit alpha
MVLFLAVNGYLMDIKVEKVSAFVINCIEHLKDQKSELRKSIEETGVISVEQESELHSAIDAYKEKKK